MSRPDRCFVPGGYYHLTARGNNGRPIFLDDEDRSTFVRLLGRIAVRFALDVHAWCLMTNHYHLVVATRTGEISPAMQYLNGEYARAFNERHGRTGHLFRARFRASEIAEDEHLERACLYVVLNPVRAGVVSRPQHWPWSGPRGAVGVAS